MNYDLLVELNERIEQRKDSKDCLAQISELLQVTTLMQSATLARIEQILGKLQMEDDACEISRDETRELVRACGLIVLVIDDEPFNRKLICHHLQSCGALAIAANSVVDAIAILSSNHVDLMLIDETLQDGDGDQAWQALQRAAETINLPSVGFLFSDAARVPEQNLNETPRRFRLRKPATFEDIWRFVNFRQHTPGPFVGLRQVWGEPPM